MRTCLGVMRLVRVNASASLLALAGLVIWGAAVAACITDTDAKAGPTDPPAEGSKPKNVLFETAKWDDIPILASGNAWKAYADQSLRLEVGDHLGFAIVLDTIRDLSASDDEFRADVRDLLGVAPQ